MNNAYSFSVIFFEKSLPEFKAPALNGKYLHFGKTVFDTGLELELLRRFYWDRLSGVEIAQAMNYSNADSVKTQKNKCMKKLKPIVEKFRRL